MAIKALRNNAPSGNLLANVHFEPTQSFNFLENDFLTRIPEFTNGPCKQTIESRFLEIDRWPNTLGLSEFSLKNTNGDDATAPDFPFDLYFRPNEDIKAQFDSTRDPDATWWEQMMSIEASEVLFTVMAAPGPDTEPVNIA